MSNTILVTTTSSIEGWEIQKYIKPVSAHIVAGTDFFSDFAASFTDFLGGRSSNYQRQISSLYNEAIKQLQQAAHEIGANCVIGLSVDMDEISGKGKSMFMVTAVGTAVKAKAKEVENAGTESLDNDKILTSDNLSLIRRKKKIIFEAENNNLPLHDEQWAFIIDNQIYELFPYLLQKWSSWIDVSSDDNNQVFKNKLLQLLYTIPDNVRTKLLYDAILNEKNGKVVSSLTFLLRDLQIWDFRLIKQNLNSEDFTKQKRSLILTLYDKPFYTSSDLEEINELIELIDSKFNEKGQRTTKKQLLSSKEKEVWNCTCGKQNISDEYCPSCNNDIYGFNEKEVKPERTISILKDRQELLKDYYKLN